MTLELVLDILVSVIVLAIYHSDCTPTGVAEFHTIAPEAYDHTIVPMPTSMPDEWLLDDDQALTMEASESLLDEWAAIVDRDDDWSPEFETAAFESEALMASCIEKAFVEVTGPWISQAAAQEVNDSCDLGGYDDAVGLEDTYEAPSLAAYGDMSARKLKAMAKEMSLPGWSRMSQPKLAQAVYDATIARESF